MILKNEILKFVQLRIITINMQFNPYFAFNAFISLKSSESKPPKAKNNDH